MSGSPVWLDVDAACRGLLGTGSAEATRLAGGPNSTVYRVTLPWRQPRSVIVKLYAGRARWKAAKEHQVIGALADAASRSRRFGVPGMLANGQVPGTDAAALILQDLGSLSLRAAADSGVCSRRQTLQMVGGLLAAFRQVACLLGGSRALPTGPVFADQVTTLQGRLPDELRTATNAALAQAADLAEERPHVWCHGDLHLDNVLLQPAAKAGRPHLVDFADTTLAVPEYDIAQTAVTADALAPDERSLIVAAYGADIAAELLDSLIIFQALRGWLWAAVRERRDVTLWESRLKHTLDQYARSVRPPGADTLRRATPTRR